jgi:hypothetical protein
VALGDPYVTLTDLKELIGKQGADQDERITDALLGASRGIDDHCDRQFNKAGSVSARVYVPESRKLVKVDDFHTTTGLVVRTDDDDDGVFETTWTASEYQLEPLNGVVGGTPGWPWCTIRAVGSRRFPCSANGRASVQVTADWGWNVVPEPVKAACRIVAIEAYKLPEAPFGIAGFGDFAMRVRDNPMARSKLAPYQRYPWLGA